MSFQTQRILAIAVAILIAALGFVQFGNAELLGISPRVSAWLAVLTSVLGVAAGFLPPIHKSTDPAVPPSSPDEMVALIEGLSPFERRQVSDILVARHGGLVTQSPTWLAPEGHG